MRLTLRTLLAYLDNTLDPADAETLRTKVAESGFAGQLVQRIRTSVSRGDLGAPAPDAAGPVEEANAISEFLDSTLPAEQVAEIERACLESDTQLAEAAACHQILTMVLGKTAEVSPELRKRIYTLPDREIADIAAAGSFSSVTLPSVDPDGAVHDLAGLDASLQPGAAGADSSETLDAGQRPDAVQPVGPGDSGVADAPTRIRQSDEAAASDAVRAGSLAGSRPRSALEAAQLYGGSIRTSRIAPWLVSLALAGLLLFALVQIFEPLLDRGKLAQNNDTVDSPSTDDGASGVQPSKTDSASSSTTAEIEVSAKDSPPMVPVGQPAKEIKPETPSDPSDVAALPDAEELPMPTPQADLDASAGPDQESAVVMEDVDQAKTSPSAVADSSVSEQTDSSDANAPPIPPTVEMEKPASEEIVLDNSAEEQPETATDTVPAEPPAEEKLGIAVVNSDSGLVFVLDEAETPTPLNRSDVVGPGQNVVCSPTYRCRIDSTADVAVTMIGPARVKWTGGGEEQTVLHLLQGRVLLEATKAGSTAEIVVDESQMSITFPSIETLVALSVAVFRAPGFDPSVPENHLTTIGVLVPQGEAEIQLAAESTSLTTGQRWIKRGIEPAVTSTAETMPDWILTPDPNDRSLESSARDALLSLMVEGQPAELSLLEATMFRRAEVGALAARTLLSLGRADVFFGGDGMLNNPEQRLYWIDHYQALTKVIDHDPESAERVRDSMSRMDSANARALYQLLVGYSPKQLSEGGDAELVASLDSPSMAVRALALENLRRITDGATLGYRPEQDSSLRRAQAIKKWEARQRKGDIQWQTP
ncbi:hypothetical protein [Novipirellula artificiosorum]|uniref:Uncharacterized protein n=1 Tax=Novipirellula artificiosorum TaxID=2528016 RepID=A0A5C6D820_9BACT|nr:hypothetical protein [Novipirellula artificiosorum]TWU32980.1 hypothetical protein Poly41_53590 [Novipirellula artificiosorum]